MMSETLKPGYDWLCKCGESNYAEEDTCEGCGKPRGDGEVDSE